jgi:hypothetical protein
MSQYTAKKLEGAIDDLLYALENIQELLPDFNNCKNKVLELLDKHEDKKFISNCEVTNPSLIALMSYLEKIRADNKPKLRQEFENWIQSTKDREHLFDLWLSLDEN